MLSRLRKSIGWAKPATSYRQPGRAATCLASLRYGRFPGSSGFGCYSTAGGLLESAGIDEATAFQGADRLHETLHRLDECGIGVPWTAPTGLTHTTLLNVCSWVWGEGGDFITPDGKRTQFAEPPALAGISKYFELGRYIPVHVRHLNALQPDEQFLSDPQTAVTISGTWLFEFLTGERREEIHVALPPGRLLLADHTSSYGSTLATVKLR